MAESSSSSSSSAAAAAAAAAAAETAPQRKPFTGSCHCGAIKYTIHLTVPIQLPPAKKIPTQAVGKCNCTICHKVGMFHVRLADATRDFALHSPLDPLSSLGNYQCASKRLNWLFCTTCGVRCFTFTGAHEVVADEDDGDGNKKIWRPKRDVFKEGPPSWDSYLSVNAVTLDVGQGDELDLRNWVDRSACFYSDWLGQGGKPKGDVAAKPFPGGCY